MLWESRELARSLEISPLTWVGDPRTDSERAYLAQR